MITQREIYLDSNATHPLLPSVREALAQLILTQDGALGNPSSIHRKGQKAKKAVADLKEALCQVLGRGDGDEFILLSGATEALNLSLRGFVEDRRAAGRQPHFITSVVEHSAVLDTVAKLGMPTTLIGVHSNGQLKTENLKEACAQALTNENTDVLLILQLSNNETGVSFELDALFAELHALYAPRPLKNLPKLKGGKYPQTPQRLWIALDAAQALCKLDPARVRRALHYADYAALSAHKMGGPSGMGSLWVRPRSPFAAQMTGGSQEKKRRAGTLNALGAVGFRLALEAWQQQGGSWRQQWSELQRFLADELLKIPGVILHGLGPRGELPALANTLNFHLEDCPEESLLLALDLDGFCISSGSACNSGSLSPSHVLTAMGFKREEALSSIRVCLSVESTREELEAFVESVRIKSTQIRKARQECAEWLPDIPTEV